MSNVDKKRRPSKPSHKASSVLGTVKRQGSGRTPRYDDVPLGSFDGTHSPFAPSQHLVSFQSSGSANVVQIEQSSELDKLSSKLFGIPLLAGTNFGLRIHAGTEAYVPLVVKDTIDWLAHYVHDEQDTITALLTEDPDKGLLERLIKKLNKDAHCALSQNIHASTVWHLLKSYIALLPETPITFDVYSDLVVAQTTESIASILNRLPMENRSLVKRLIWLLGEFLDQTRTPAEEHLLISSFSQLLFNVSQPDYNQMVQSAGIVGSVAEGSRDKRDKLFGIVSTDSPIALLSKRELVTYSLMASIMDAASAISDRIVECTVPTMLEDEDLIHRVYRTRIGSYVDDASVYVTNYRIIIQFSNKDEVSIPIMTIRFAEMLSSSKKRRSRSVSLTTKDYRSFQLEFEAALFAIMFWDVLTSLLTPKNPKQTFPFRWKPHYPLPASQGWGIYDAVDEFERQGVLKTSGITGEKSLAHLRFTKMNAAYDVLSYPAGWVVPTAIEDSDIRRMLQSRLRQRIPILSWAKPGYGMLLRADEPDLSNMPDSKDAKALNRAAIDLRLMDAYSAGCQGKLIVDVGPSRTYKYAFAGSGWEMAFLDAVNNRALTDHFAAFLTEVEASDKRSHSNINLASVIGTISAKGGIGAAVQALSVEDTYIESHWVQSLQKVLSTASSIAGLISTKNDCILLTHVPGNDLDFVISSLAQIMVDGHYRTINGLAVLLEKDWSSFGYDWSRKLGHSAILYSEEVAESTVSSSGASVTSSVITPTTSDQTPSIDLFVEAIWQMTLQFPMHFEYTENFLIYLLDSIYSGRFGTFLLNSEKERESSAKDKTTSFWAHINTLLQNEDQQEEFVNFFYDPDTVFTVLEPRYEMASLKLWYSKHLSQRQHAEMIGINTLVEEACNVRPVRASDKTSPSSEVPTIAMSPPKWKTDPQLLAGTLSSPKDSSSSSDLQSVDGSVSETASVTSARSESSMSTSRSEASSFFPSSDPAEPTTDLPEIVELDLSRKGLNLVPHSVCIEKNANKLQSLNFSHNKLNFFPSDILRLTRLRRLNLSNNPIGDISRDHFFMMGARMTMLQQLDLSNTNIAYLPDDISTLRYLRILIIKQNQLEELPPNISSLLRLEVLDARKNKLKSIPKSTFKLHSLRVLALGDNSILMADEAPIVPTASLAAPLKSQKSSYLVPSPSQADLLRGKSLSTASAVAWSFRNLVNLDVLDWRGNSKESDNEIPSGIFSLPAVHSLHLEDNAISKLSPEIGKLTSLTFLNLSFNQLTALPEEVTQLTNLVSLSISNNRLSSLPVGVHVLPLRSLNLSNNRFKEVPPHILNMTDITMLNFSDNKLRSVPTALVDNLGKLTVLDLSNNHIETLDNLPMIGTLSRLRTLALQGNQFERLPLDLWRLDGTLKELSVDTSPSTRIVFPPRDVIVRGTAPTLRYLSERAAMGETDSRINIIVIGDLPVQKNALMKKIIRAPHTGTSKQSTKELAAHVSSLSLLSSGAMGRGSVIGSTLSSSRPGSSSVSTVEKYEWAITSSSSSSVTGDAAGKSDPAPSSRHLNSEVHTIVWEINLDANTTRSFLHPAFLNDRSFYVITWEISPLKDSLHNWLEIVTTRSKKAQFVVLGLHVGDTVVQKEYAIAMEQELGKRYGNAFRGFILASSSSKTELKAVQTRLEEAILDSSIPRDSHPASYFTMERMLLACEFKPPILAYSYFESVAKSCGVKDLKKLVRHLMSLGLMLHIADSPLLEKILFLDPLWAFAFMPHLRAGQPTNNVKYTGLVSHESYLNVAKSLNRSYHPIVIPTLVALQNALGLAFPLAILTPQLRSNLGVSSPQDSCFAAEAFTLPKNLNRLIGGPAIPPFQSSVQLQQLGINDPSLAHLVAIFNDPTLLQAPYMSENSFASRYSLVPAFCEEVKTSVLTRFWPRSLPASYTIPVLQCGRKYIFATSPHLLFHRLLSRVVALTKVECLYRTACLIINSAAPYGDSLATVTQAEMIHISFSSASKAIKIIARTSAGVNVLTDIYETMDSLMRDMRMGPTNVLLPCPHCLDARVPKPHHFTLEQAESASIIPNAVLYCHDFRPIFAKYVSPEMALSNIAVGKQVNMSDIEVIKLVGEGAAAEVFLGDLDGELVAVKRLRVLKKNSADASTQDIMVGNDTTASKALAEFRREIRFLSKFKHTAIVGLKGVVLDPPCIITEYCDGGNLFEYCHPPRVSARTVGHTGETPRPRTMTDPNTISAVYPINWSIRLKIALDIAEGMSLLHANSPAITHRDLKSPNILLRLSSSRVRPLQRDKSAGSLAGRSPSSMSFHTPPPVAASNAIAALTSSEKNMNTLTASSGSVAADDSITSTPQRSSATSLKPKFGSRTTSSEYLKSPRLAVGAAVNKAKMMSLEDRLNMWTGQDAIAKITDFGLTGVSPAVAGREVDNPVWLAPEVMMRGVEYAEQADVYSFAVILYELLTNREYFGHLSFMTDIERAVLGGQRPLLPAAPQTVPGAAVAAAAALLNGVDQTPRTHRGSVDGSIASAAYALESPGSGSAPHSNGSSPTSGNPRPSKTQFAHTGIVSASTGAILTPTSRTVQRISEQTQSQSSPILKVPVKPENAASFPEDLWRVPEFIHLMDHCLSSNPSERPTFAEIVETLKFIIMLHPEYASSISFTPASDVAVHTASMDVVVAPEEPNLTLDLCPETRNIEFMGGGEPISTMFQMDDHVWIGFSTGMLSCYRIPASSSMSRSSSSQYLQNTTSSSSLVSQSPIQNTAPHQQQKGDEVSAANAQLHVTNLAHTASGSLKKIDPIADSASGEEEDSAHELLPMLVGTYRHHKASVSVIGAHNGGVCVMSCDKQVSTWTWNKTDAREKVRAPVLATLEPLDDVPTGFTSSAPTLNPSSVAASVMGSLSTDQLVVTVKNGGLRYYDASTSKWKDKKLAGAAVANCIIRAGPTSQYWIGTDRKILRLDDSFKIVDYLPVPDTTVNAMVRAAGTVWAACADGSIRVYDEVHSNLLRTLTAHNDEVLCLLQVGNQVWSGGKDKHLVVWSVPTFRMLKEIRRAHSDSITALCLVQNCEVWSGSNDKQIGRWRISASARQSILKAEEEPIQLSKSLLLSVGTESGKTPSSGLLASSTEDSSTRMSLDISSETTDSTNGISPSQSKRKKKKLDASMTESLKS